MKDISYAAMCDYNLLSKRKYFLLYFVGYCFVSLLLFLENCTTLCNMCFAMASLSVH